MARSAPGPLPRAATAARWPTRFTRRASTVRVKDFATSDNPAVQAQLDRLAALSLPQGRFGLETIRVLLARLGDPQERLPPVFHVAGTNGKGSTCAFLRAMLEAQGLIVHADDQARIWCATTNASGWPAI
jgi:hypothetical protein